MQIMERPVSSLCSPQCPAAVRQLPRPASRLLCQLGRSRTQGTPSLPLPGDPSDDAPSPPHLPRTLQISSFWAAPSHLLAHPQPELSSKGRAKLHWHSQSACQVSLRQDPSRAAQPARPSRAGWGSRLQQVLTRMETSWKGCSLGGQTAAPCWPMRLWRGMSSPGMWTQVSRFGCISVVLHDIGAYCGP